MAYTPAVLTGHYQTPDGQPAKGTVEIIPNSKQIIDAEGDVILAGRVKATLEPMERPRFDATTGEPLLDGDGNPITETVGAFSVNLPPTDDATLEPATGRQYTIVAKLHSSHLPAIPGVELAAGETVDVADVSAQPVTDALVTPAASEAQLAALEESVTTSLATKAEATTVTALDGRVDTVETNLAGKVDIATQDAMVADFATTPGTETNTALSATFAARSTPKREVLRAVPTPPLHPSPPTVALGAANAATTLSGTTAEVANNAASLTYAACLGTVTPAAWYRLGATPNGSSNDQGAPFDLHFMIDSADFEIKIAGQSANRGYRLWIDGQPTTATTQAGPGATGGTHRLRLTFASRAVRHVRIRTNAGIVGLTTGGNDTVFPTTRPVYSGRAYFLGDSFTAGAGTTYQLDGLIYHVADAFGWEPMNGGQLGTGYNTNGGGAGGRDTFANRATNDVPDVDPDVVIVYGGTNDTDNAGLSTGAAATFANLDTSVPGVPVYVFGVQYPNGSADATRDSKDAKIAAAAAAAPNVELFQSVKSWLTGTGTAGAPTATGNASIITSADGLHPTTNGHEQLGKRIAATLYDYVTPVA